MDQKVYTWTDKIYVTIVAPDHNFDSGLVDLIGDTDDDPLIVQTSEEGRAQDENRGFGLEL
jgi:hypothetical protein